MLIRLFKLVKRFLSSRIGTGIISVFVTYVVLNVLGGIIGNSAYNGSTPPWLDSVLGGIFRFITANLLTITAIVSGVTLIIISFLVVKNVNISKALNATNSLAELDDSLLRLLTGLVSEYQKKPKEVLQKEVRRLLHELLRDATRTITGDKNKGRAAIFVPETAVFFQAPSSSQEYLKAFAFHRLSEKSVERALFYIGSDEIKDYEHGTVGEVYQDKHMRIINFVQNGSQLECDDESYRNFDESRARLPYVTIVNLPIIGPSKNTDISCLGVLCFDSTTPHAFASFQTKRLLETISGRIAAVLTIYIELMKVL